MDATQPLEMLEQIKRKVREAGFATPKDSEIRRAFAREQKHDPSAFDSLSGRELLAQDIADDFISKERRKAGKVGGDVLRKEELSTAGRGIEYSVLIAKHLKPHVERLRQDIWGSIDAPFELSEEAGAWIRETYQVECDVFGEPPIIQWLRQKRSGSSDPALPIPKGRSLHFEVSEKTHINCFPPPGGSLERLQTFCERIAAQVKAWHSKGILLHLLFDALPSVKVGYGVVSALTPYAAIKLTIPYPATKEEVLNAYADALPLAGWLSEDPNKFPQELSEHHRRLILLVYEMPEGRYSWPMRLERYLELYKNDALMPKYGLESGTGNKKSFDNAWRNLSRDYRAAIQKCDWTLSAHAKLKLGAWDLKLVGGRIRAVPEENE